jgi:hypothetical protein
VSELQKYTVETILIGSNGNAVYHSPSAALYPAAEVDAKLAVERQANEELAMRGLLAEKRVAELEARVDLMQKRIDDAESAKMILRGSHDRLLQVIARHVGDKVLLQRAVEWLVENCEHMEAGGQLSFVCFNLAKQHREYRHVPADLAAIIKVQK